MVNNLPRRPQRRRGPVVRACARWTLVALLGLLGPAAVAERAPLNTVENFDLSRYLGRWYQIALLPHKFQADCVGDTRADYAREADGQIRVVNRCRDSSNATIRAQGRARLNAEFNDPARLQVRFAPRWLSWLSAVWGDYWVLAIDPDYSAVLVGAPDREYLWVLAREPRMRADTYAEFMRIADEAGFPIDKLAREPGTTIDGSPAD